MGKVIVIEFVTLDGVVEDPDGSGGTPWGGWAFRYGPEAVAGDKFALGEILDQGVMLLGRTTWQLFAKIWPGRDDDFSRKMNAMPKLVASRSLASVDYWANSTLLRGDLTQAVAA
jgi:dihydrofolate reductase